LLIALLTRDAWASRHRAGWLALLAYAARLQHGLRLWCAGCGSLFSRVMFAPDAIALAGWRWSTLLDRSMACACGVQVADRFCMTPAPLAITAAS